MIKYPVLTEDRDTAPVGFAIDEEDAVSILREVYTNDLGRIVVTARLQDEKWIPSIIWDKELDEVTRT